MKAFLNERTFLYDRIKLGIDVHPSEQELIKFELYAKQISPHQDFAWRGCQECVNHLVKFVFENQSKFENKPAKEKKMTFPKHKSENND